MKPYLMLCVAALLGLAGCAQTIQPPAITSFDECVAAGFPVMESYPRQCRAGDQTFTETIAPVQGVHVCSPDELQAEICTLEYAPVCGDDGVTYGNGCMACASGDITSYTDGVCEGIPESEARIIADASCLDGVVGDEAFFNEGTRTWWFDFTPDEPLSGCNPACVVDVSTGQAEMNWRCTGLLP